MVVDGGGDDVDSFGDLGAVGADQLGAEQAVVAAVAGDAHVDGGGARVVGLVVVDLDGRADRVVSGGGGFGVAEAGAGGDEAARILTAWVPSEPAKRASPPAALMPATRPCLWAVVPSGRYVGCGVSTWWVCTQSPAAQMPSMSVAIRSSTTIAPRPSTVIPVAEARLESRRTPTATSTASAVRSRSAGRVPAIRRL